MRSLFAITGAAVLLLFLLPLNGQRDWRKTDRSSTGQAPDPRTTPEAVVQLYAARTYNAWGLAVHSWIGLKEAGDTTYTTYQVMGFRLKRTGTAIVIQQELPDCKWYGAYPDLLAELRGREAESAIPKIQAAVASYPYPATYRSWPGPNSNTFISHIIRNTPELGVELPPHAVGKDWLTESYLAAYSETGTGFQLSLCGVLGLTAGLAEGVEFNLLGLSFGADICRPALKLPFIGRVGLKDKPLR